MNTYIVLFEENRKKDTINIQADFRDNAKNIVENTLWSEVSVVEITDAFITIIDKSNNNNRDKQSRIIELQDNLQVKKNTALQYCPEFYDYYIGNLQIENNFILDLVKCYNNNWRLSPKQAYHLAKYIIENK